MAETRWQEILRLQAEVLEKQSRIAYLMRSAEAAGELRLGIAAIPTNASLGADP